MSLDISASEMQDIACPICGHEFTHQIKLEAFCRVEDSAHVSQLGVTGLDSPHPAVSFRSTTDKMSRNPSARRDGILIRIRCEECESESHLAIVQHKGQTLIGWKLSNPASSEASTAPLKAQKEGYHA